MKTAEHPLSGILRTFRYKPGWTFQLTELFQYDALILTITAQVPDSMTGRPAPAPVSLQIPVPDFPGDRDWWLRWLVVDIIHEQAEAHEVAEWAEVDGVKPFFPHQGPTTVRGFHRHPSPPPGRPAGKHPVEGWMESAGLSPLADYQRRYLDVDGYLDNPGRQRPALPVQDAHPPAVYVDEIHEWNELGHTTNGPDWMANAVNARLHGEQPPDFNRHILSRRVSKTFTFSKDTTKT